MLFGEVVDARASTGGNGGEDNRGKGDGAGIRLANAFISIRRGRVTCSPLRSISSTSFARSPPHLPSAVLLSSPPPPIPFRLLFPFLLSLALVISLSLLPSVFLSSCLYSPPPLPSSPFRLSFMFSSFMDLLSVRFCFPSADLFLFSQRRAERANISSPLLGGFSIGADVFRLNERR